MDGIVSMITEILSVCRAIPEEERKRFQTAREVIGNVQCVVPTYMKERQIITVLTEIAHLHCGRQTIFWKA